MRSTLLRSIASAVLLLASITAANAAVRGHQTDPVAQVTQIPFSDWLAAQGTTLVAFVARENSKPNSTLADESVVDYAGERAAANHLSYGFTATGSVSLTTFQDGTGEVLVNEDFSNAINWAYDTHSALIFGYTPGELAGNASDAPALASGHIQIAYRVTDAGNPALDLATVIFNGGGTVEQLKLHSDGAGPLRAAFGVTEGTPGACVVAMNGLMNTSGGGATGDQYPVESVNIFATGALTSSLSSSAMTSAPGTTGAPQSPAARGTKSTWGAIKALYRQ